MPLDRHTGVVCEHSDVRYFEEEKGAVACMDCGRLFGHLIGETFRAYNPSCGSVELLQRIRTYLAVPPDAAERFEELNADLITDLNDFLDAQHDEQGADTMKITACTSERIRADDGQLGTALLFPADHPAVRHPGACRQPASGVTVDIVSREITVDTGGWIDGPTTIGAGWTVKGS